MPQMIAAGKGEKGRNRTEYPVRKQGHDQLLPEWLKYRYHCYQYIFNLYIIYNTHHILLIRHIFVIHKNIYCMYYIIFRLCINIILNVIYSVIFIFYIYLYMYINTLCKIYFTYYLFHIYIP